MSVSRSNCCLAVICVFFSWGSAWVDAHEGRRFDATVIDGQLFAQGANTGNPDGQSDVRPYFNSLHDHFLFVNAGGPIGLADLPSWDIGVLPDSDIAPLIGHDLTLTMTGAGKWTNIPAQDGSGINQDFGTPELIVMDSDYLTAHPEEVIAVGGFGPPIDTLSMGKIQLAVNIAGTVDELDLSYVIGTQNSDEIYFIEWQLTTDAPGVSASAPIYSILSPDGMGPVERLHFQSLYLEAWLGTYLNDVLLGDVNLDGHVDLLDVSPFVALLTGGSYLQEADMNQDGIVSLLDVSLFVDALAD